MLFFGNYPIGIGIMNAAVFSRPRIVSSSTLRARN
jgi:hypothetical protein